MHDEHILGFHMTSPTFKLIDSSEFLLHELLQQLNTFFIHTKFFVRKGSSFCARGLWRLGKLFMWVEKISNFQRFWYLNIPCLRINVTFTFMSSSSDELTHLQKHSKTAVSVGFLRPYLCPSKRHQHSVSIQSLLY